MTMRLKMTPNKSYDKLIDFYMYSKICVKSLISELWEQARHKLREVKFLIVDKTRFNHMCVLQCVYNCK